MTDKREWRCFFCDEVFTDRKEAALHFGCEVTDQAACRTVTADEKGLLLIIADQAKQLWQWRNECDPLGQVLSLIDSKLSRDTRDAEERGYQRGLEDGRRDWLKIMIWRLKARFS